MFENAQFQGILGCVCVCWQFSSGSFYKRTDRWQQKWQKIIKNQQRMCLGKCAPESEANKRKWKWNKSGIWNVCFSCKRIQFLMSFGHFSSVTWNLWNFSSIFELCDTHTRQRRKKNDPSLHSNIYSCTHIIGAWARVRVLMRACKKHMNPVELVGSRIETVHQDERKWNFEFRSNKITRNNKCS